MSGTFLLPYDPPAKWTLLDLLYWVACKKLPLSKYDSGGIEIRDSCEFIFENHDSFGENALSELTKHDLKRLEIFEPNPSNYENINWEVFEQENPRFTERTISKNPTAEDKQEWAGLRTALKNYNRDWKDQIFKKLELSKLEIISAMQRGLLKPEGMAVSPKSDFWSTHGESLSMFDSNPDSFLPIKCENWLYQQVDWEASSLTSKNWSFFVVRVNIQNIFDVFPVPDGTLAEIRIVGDFGFSKKPLALYPIRPKTGRPKSIRWDKIFLKASEIIYTEGGLPQQNQLAYDIQAWYLLRFSQKIATSTLKKRLKPFYDSDVFVENLKSSTKFD